MMTTTPDWGDGTKPPARSSSQFVRRPENNSFLIFLGNPRWVETHFFGDRTRPCMDGLKMGPCPQCRGNLGIRLRAYTPGLYRVGQEAWGPCVLDLTSRTVEQAGDLPLRGKCFMVKFQRKVSNTSAWLLDLRVQNTPANLVLPEPFDVVPHLEALWGLRRAKVEVDEDEDDEIEIEPAKLKIVHEEPRLTAEELHKQGTRKRREDRGKGSPIHPVQAEIEKLEAELLSEKALDDVQQRRERGAAQLTEVAEVLKSKFVAAGERRAS